MSLCSTHDMIVSPWLRAVHGASDRIPSHKNLGHKFGESDKRSR